VVVPLGLGGQSVAKAEMGMDERQPGERGLELDAELSDVDVD
jgi:hypothetical protein